MCCFSDTATTDIYTLSLHDALPIYPVHLVEEAFSLAVQLAFDAQCREFIGHHANAPTGCVGPAAVSAINQNRSEEHTSELQSHSDIVCRLLLEKKKTVPIERCVRAG